MRVQVGEVSEELQRKAQVLEGHVKTLEAEKAAMAQRIETLVAEVRWTALSKELLIVVSAS